MKTTTLFITAALGLLGLKALANARTGNSLVANIADVALNAQGTNVQLRIKLRLINPTNNTVTITGITGTAVLDNTINGTIGFAATTQIAPGETDIWVPVTINPLELLKVLQVTPPADLVLDLLITTPTLQIPLSQKTTVL